MPLCHSVESFSFTSASVTDPSPHIGFDGTPKSGEPLAADMVYPRFLFRELTPLSIYPNFLISLYLGPDYVRTTTF